MPPPAEENLRAALQARADEFFRALAGVRAAPAREATHDLSTALRRLLACDRVCAAVCGKKLFNPENFRRMNRLRKALNPARDAHEMPVKFRTLAVPPSCRDTLAQVLDQHCAKACSALAAAAEKFDTLAIAAALRDRRIAKICRLPYLLPPEEYATQLARRTRRALAAAQSGDDDRRLHRLRIHFKYLRYTAELLAPPAPRKTPDQAQAFQTLLGEAHDWSVLRDFLFRRTSGKKRCAPCRARLEERRARESDAVRAYLRTHAQELHEYFLQLGAATTPAS